MRPRHHRRHDDRDRARADLADSPELIASAVESERCGNGGKPTSVDIRYDTPAGLVQARAHLAHHGDAVRVESVAFRNVASFVFEPSLMVPIGGRKIPVDVAFGGAFYAIVDAEAAGVPIDAAHLPELRKLGMTIAREVEKLRRVVHPNDAGLEGIYGTIFTAPAQLPDAHLRNVTIFADAEVDRSPCGTGTAAVMAVLNDMGLLLDDVPFVHESIVGTTFKGRVVDRAAGGREAGDRPRDRRVRLDHRRTHVPDRRGRSAEGRVPAVGAARLAGYFSDPSFAEV